MFANLLIHSYYILGVILALSITIVCKFKAFAVLAHCKLSVVLVSQGCFLN